MTALGVAKALLCKNRFDSFSAAEGAPEGDGAMICKWRADSFAAGNVQAEGVLPREHTNTELEMQRHGARERASLKAHPDRRRSAPDNRQREAAYLEALAQQRGELPPSPNAGGPPPLARRRQKGGICAGDSDGPFQDTAPQQLPEECSWEMEARLEAMEMAASQAAIRQSLEREMQSACASSSSSFSALQPQPVMTQPSMSPARARRGSTQPGQQGRRSRSSLPMQPKQGQALVATAVAGQSLSRSSSFDNSSFRHTADKVKAAATETFLVAESFRQAAMSPRPQRSESFHSPRARRTSTFGRIESFGAPTSPMPRTSSFGQLHPGFTNTMPLALPQADWQRPASPCTSRSSSFSVRSGGVVLSRSNSISLMPPSSVVLQPVMGVPPSSSYAPVAVPNAAAIQRAAAMVEEQAQLAARLNIASEMIDSLVMDSSVLDEAKRLTDAVARKQQQRRQAANQQQQRHMSPSPQAQSPFAAAPGKPRQTPGRPASRDALFWKPPPEAARLCARCPSLDPMTAAHQNHAMRRTPSMDLARMAPVSARRSFVSPRAK